MASRSFLIARANKDFATAIERLLSEDADFITVQTYFVDGGPR